MQQSSSVSTLVGIPWPALRWLPFVAAALLSLMLAAAAPDGRKPFYIDWSLGRDALAFSIFKLPHIGASALLAVLGVFAAGRRSWPLALGLTVLVGWGWELSQTTVAGHHARLSDLAPDTLGALLGCALGSYTLRLFELAPIRARRRR